MRKLSKPASLALPAAVALALMPMLWPVHERPALDEARAAGKTPADFPPAANDYFRGMDGGIALSEAEVRGRNTWLAWTGGNEAFWDWLANHSFGTFDMLKTLSSYPCSPEQERTARRAEALPGSAPQVYRLYKRETRFRFLGLMNEPGFRQASAPDEYGLCLDEPVAADRPPDFDEAVYGRASGVLGLRLFKNPNFDAAARAAWDEARRRGDAFYTDGRYSAARDLVRPYRVGMACAFCHVSHHPLHPPADPEKPEFANLSGTIGAQYFWFGRIFGANLTPDNFVWHLLDSQQPGAVDTSFIPTDYINNPRAMNAIFELPARLAAAERFHQERFAGGARRLPEVKARGSSFGVPQILWDGADSVGVDAALTRVYINIGEAHQEWIRHVRPLIGGKPQSPIEVEVLQRNSTYWNATQERAGDLASYLIRASAPMRLADLPDGVGRLRGGRTPAAYRAALERGRLVFAENCARCHSSKLPRPGPGLDGGLACAGAGYLECWNEYWDWTQTEDFKARMREIVAADDFLKDNSLSTDARIPVTLLETEICSSMASNAMAGYVWDNFSSRSYKELPAAQAQPIELYDPLRRESFRWPLPAGGRGYQRVPSLVSIWATAPLLHNNEVGVFTNDPSIEGRLRAFDDGIRKLLGLAPRDGVVRRTRPVRLFDRQYDGKSWVKVHTSALPEPLQPLLGEGFPFGLLRRLTRLSWLVNEATVEIGPIPNGTPVSLLANLNLDFNDPRVRPQRLLAFLIHAKQRLRTIHEQRLDDARAAEVLAELVPELRQLSACPDFLVDRGHNFGTELPDADKEALIDFVKTF